MSMIMFSALSLVWVEVWPKHLSMVNFGKVLNFFFFKSTFSYSGVLTKIDWINYSEVGYSTILLMILYDFLKRNIEFSILKLKLPNWLRTRKLCRIHALDRYCILNTKAMQHSKLWHYPRSPKQLQNIFLWCNWNPPFMPTINATLS